MGHRQGNSKDVSLDSICPTRFETSGVLIPIDEIAISKGHRYLAVVLIKLFNVELSKYRRELRWQAERAGKKVLKRTH